MEKENKKRKRENNLDDLVLKHHSLEEKYKGKRIYYNRFTYLKNEKDKLYNILPNIKSVNKQKQKKNQPQKHQEVQITRVEFGEFCNDCNVFMKIILQESILCCPMCGISKQIPLYSITSAESDFFVPKALQNKARIIDWLQNVQGNDSGDAKAEIIEELCSFIYKQRRNKLCDYLNVIANQRKQGGIYKSYSDAIKRLHFHIPNIEMYLKSINHSFIRTCLEDMKNENTLLEMHGEDQNSHLKRCYEKAPKYASSISGLKPLCFTSQQEEKIKYMYSLAAPEYERHKGKYKNWPGGYAYFLKCLCALLGYDEFIDHFENFSTNTKIKEEREMFRKKVWGILKWQYFSMEHPLPKINILK